MLKKIPPLLILLFFLIFLCNFFVLRAPVSSLPRDTETVLSSFSFDIPVVTNSKSTLLINLDVDAVVCAKNIDERLPIASLTKIMTAIIVLESVSDISKEKVYVKPELMRSLDGTGSSLSGIKAGENVTVEMLLHGLLITSGNDAALVLADYVGKGNVDSFVAAMNKKATELGCTDTHFTNPHGLDEDQHYSTAKDIATITKYAMKNFPVFEKITSMSTSTILGEKRYPLVTTNSMIDRARGGKYYYKYAKGIKTGYSSLAGKCLVSTAFNGQHSYMCVILGAFSDNSNENPAMDETKNLYQWAFENLDIKSVTNTGSPLGEVKLKLAWGKKKLGLCAVKDCRIVLPKDVMSSSLNCKIDVPDAVNAPVSSGQVLGKATLSYANFPVAVVGLTSAEDIKMSNILFALHVVTSFFYSIWFKLAMIFLLMFVIFLSFCRIRFGPRKKNVKQKKYSLGGNRGRRFKV